MPNMCTATAPPGSSSIPDSSLARSLSQRLHASTTSADTSALDAPCVRHKPLKRTRGGLSKFYASKAQ